MAVTLKEVEAIPATYPPMPLNLSPEALALNHAALWARIEAYCRVRWTPREVVWTVEGEGAWEAPLQPSIMNAVEVWERGMWTDCTPAASPWGGYDLPGDGPYRLTADVGAGDVPAVVSEAFRRLAEYSAEIGDRGMMKDAPGATSYSSSIGEIEESFERSASWVARALDHSGAADLLRPYKRRA